MSAVLSKKPYIIRAIYEWCADSALTPYLSIKVDSTVRVPMEYVKDGEIVLSVSLQATRNLTMGNDLIQFSARFNGVSREISVPLHAVQAIFARENGQGYFFEPEVAPDGAPNAAKPVKGGKTLTSVASITSVTAAPLLQAVPKTSTPVSNDVADETDDDTSDGGGDDGSKGEESDGRNKTAAATLTSLTPQPVMKSTKTIPKKLAENIADSDPDPDKPPSTPRGGLRIIK